MSTPTTENQNPPQPTAADVERLSVALEAAREEVKATKAKAAERRAAYIASLGLSAEADDATILAAVAKVDVPKINGERDQAVARANEIEGRWTGEKINAAITSALAKSGMIPLNYEDAANFLRPLLTMEKGQVVTKSDAAGIIGGMTVEQVIHAQLKNLRSWWWPDSQGGGARGAVRYGDGNSTPDGHDVFDPRSRTYSIMAQSQYESRHGIVAARKAAARYGRKLVGE